MKRNIWLQFAKSKVCMLCTIACFIVTWGFLIFFNTLGQTGVMLLHVMARFNFWLCVFFVCISYYYISGADRNFVKEASDGANRVGVYEITASYLMFFIVLIWNLGAVVNLLLSSAANDGNSYFLTLFPMSYLCNVLLPQIIVVLMTFLVSASIHPNRWIIVEIFFLFMISPISEIIVWEQKPVIPIDAIWNKLKWHFEILYQNGQWAPDYQYGLQTENVRIYLQLFWIIFLLSLLFVNVLGKKKWGILAGITAFVFLILSEQPASLYRMNQKWNGANMESQIYFAEGDCKYNSETTPDFRIANYDLELKLRNQLSVTGTLEIKTDTAKNEFVFTLYRGYKIKNLESKTDKISATYKQKKDSFYVYTNKKTKHLQLKVQYEGYHPKYYSNSNAAMLPGWFAWYPMAGEKQIYLKYPEQGNQSGYNPYNRIETADIRLKCKKPLITNLEQTEKNYYEGTADSITVLHGNILQTEDELINSYLPLQLYSDFQSEQFIEEQKNEYAKAIEILENQCGVDTSFLKAKKILFVTEDMGRNMMNNRISVFEDYILAVYPGGIDSDTILKYLILSDYEHQSERENSTLIPWMFSFLWIDDSAKETVENFKQDLTWQMEISKETELSEDSESVKMLQALQNLLEEADEELFVKEAVGYLLNPSKYENDDAFFNAMREKL